MSETAVETAVMVESPAEALLPTTADVVVVEPPSDPAPEPMIEAEIEVHDDELKKAIAAPPALAPPASDDKNKKKTKTKSTSLAAHPKNVDSFLLHLGRCVRTRGGTDVVLLFATYSTRLAGAILALLSRTVLRATAQQLVKLAFQLPPRTSLVLATAPAPRVATIAMALSKRIQAFCAMMGDWRTMNRMWGCLAMYFAARDLTVRHLSATDRSKVEGEEAVEAGDRFESVVKHIDVALLTTYHILEAAAWLASKNVIPMSPKNRERASMVSCRAWGVSVFMEVGRALVERARRVPRGDVAAETEWRRQWTTSFIRNLCWAPLTINWGYTPFLSELSISALATYPAIGYMGDVWRATADSS